MIRDACVLLGLAGIGVGTWILSPAWSLIVVGALLLFAGVWSASR